MSDIQDRIRQLKSHFGINNVDLARYAGVTKQAAGKWANGLSMPDREALLLLREKLGVSDTWLLHGDGDMLIDASNDEFIKEVERLSPHIGEKSRESILEIIRTLAAKDD